MHDAPATSHPPVDDLRCQDEPRALTDAEVLADVDGKAEGEFNDKGLIAGRSCRDALGRVCRWHVERGMKIASCGPLPSE